jgi:flagellar biosynthesis protein FlhG
MTASSGKRTRTVSITSGKGGVGKTTMVANMAYALAQKGQRVLIFDGDLGMANIDIMFGLKSEHSIMDVLRGEKELSEVIVQLAPQISLIPGGSGIVELNRLNAFERRSLVDAVSTLDYQYDYLLIDTAPGITDNGVDQSFESRIQRNKVFDRVQSSARRSRGAFSIQSLQ